MGSAAEGAGQGRPPRVALLTGASGGIGRAVAVGLARAGHTVVLAYASNADSARAAAAEVEGLGAVALSVRADVTSASEVESIFAVAEERFGGVDVVVHAAAIATEPTAIAEVDADTLDNVLAVNVRGTFLLARAASRRVRDGGSIIMFSSSLLGMSLPGYAMYTASKAAVEAITMILARELRGRQVTVNTVAPGPTATEMFLAGKDQATIEMFAKQPPLERIGDPVDVAELVVWLAGPGRWVNGQVVRVNGGIA